MRLAMAEFAGPEGAHMQHAQIMSTSSDGKYVALSVVSPEVDRSALCIPTAMVRRLLDRLDAKEDD